MIVKAENKKIGFTAFLLFAFALLFRLYFINETVLDEPIRGDSAYYAIYAGNLINHQVFSKQQGENPTPDSYWTPGYPAFLALNAIGASVFDVDNYPVILTTQAILSSIVVAITFLLGTMFFRYSWALSASILAMFSPHMISYSGVLLTETLLSFLLLSAIYCFCLLVRKKSSVAGMLSGLFFGLAYLTNPVSLFLPLLFSLLAIFIKQDITAKKVLPCLVIFLVLVSAWSIRNVVSVEEGATTSSNRLYANLVVGAHENYHQIWRTNPRDPNNPATLDMIEFRGSYGAFAKAMKERITSRPAHYLKWYFVDKPIALWQWNVGIGFGDVFVIPVITSPYHYSNFAIASHAIMHSMHNWILLFALLGIVVGVYHWKTTNIATLVTITTLIYISSVYMFTQADARYSVPFRPEMYLLAIFFIERLYTWMSHDRYQSNKVPS